MAKDGIPQGTNSSTAFAAFNERKYYRDWAYPPPSMIPTPINLWYDKPFFGRLDYDGNSITVKNEFLTKLASTDDSNFAVNFVAEAFQDLQTYYTVAANTGRITTEKTNLKVLEGKEGWVPLEKSYFSYIELLFKTFANGFMKVKGRDKKLITFNDFLKMFELFVDYALPAFPITKTAFIASKFCDPASSGLTIKIDTMGAGDDKKNYNKIINDPNFIFYTIAAQKFGFKIDKNMPSRLVADLGSPVMQQYMYSYPKPPNYFPPALDRFYVGDVVQIPNMYDFLTWNGPVFGLQGGYEFKIKRLEPNIAFLTLLPARPQGFGDQARPYIPPKGGVLGAEPQIDERLYELIKAGIPFEELELSPEFLNGEKRQEIRRKREQYMRDLNIYGRSPKISLDNLFQEYYNPSYKADIDNLKLIVTQFYNSYILANPTVTINVRTSSVKGTKKKVILRNVVKIEDLKDQFDDLFWLKYYTKVRSKESQWKNSHTSMSKIMKKIEANYQFNGYQNTLDLINLEFRSVKKPKIMLTPGLNPDNMISEIAEAIPQPGDFPDY
jgi:hypothetical protein